MKQTFCPVGFLIIFIGSFVEVNNIRFGCIMADNIGTLVITDINVHIVEMYNVNESSARDLGVV